MPEAPESGYSSPAVAGSGTIALGLAAVATTLGQVRLLARSDASAWRAEEVAEKLCRKIDDADPGNLRVTTSPSDLSECDLIVEAIVEDPEPKVALLASLAEVSPRADLATTTSSLRVADLAEPAGITDRLYGLHVFNPVPRMDLIELCVPPETPPELGARARAFCTALGKVPIEVPDTVGFVVNRLLFPYLFDAVRMLDDLDLDPEAVDACMTKGAGQPVGPLRLLDFVGLDVALAIGESLHAESGHDGHAPPARLRSLVEAGNLGKKTGTGFYEY